MNTAPTDNESLAGKAGKVLWYIQPNPARDFRGAALAVHPVAAWLTNEGMKCGERGAYAEGPRLSCALSVEDLGASLPEFLRYQDATGLRWLVKAVAYEIEGELGVHDYAGPESYVAISDSSWVMNLRVRWSRLRSWFWRSRFHSWLFKLRLTGQLADICWTVALVAVIFSGCAWWLFWYVACVGAIGVSVVAVVLAIVNRAYVDRDMVREIIETQARVSRQKWKQMLADLERKSGDDEEK